jgi:hypothetical protein
VIGHRWEIIWTTPDGSFTREVGDHAEATHLAFYLGKQRRVGRRSSEDAITLWNPGSLEDKNVENIFIADVETLNIRKLPDALPIQDTTVQASEGRPEVHDEWWASEHGSSNGASNG